MIVTYRDFLSKMSNEELAQVIFDDTIRHMACNGSIKDSKLICPYSTRDCVRCIENLLDSDMDNIDEIGKIKEV